MTDLGITHLKNNDDVDDIQKRVEAMKDVSKYEQYVEDKLEEQREANLEHLVSLKEKYAKQAAKDIEMQHKKEESWASKTEEEKKKIIAKETAERMKQLNALAEKEQEYEDRKQALQRQIDKEHEAYNDKIKEEELKKMQTIQAKIDKSSLGSTIGSFAKAYQKDGFKGLIAGMSNLADQLDSQIETIAKYQSTIDTALQGSNRNTNATGSYWSRINKNITSLSTAATGLISQEDLSTNVVSMIKSGISFNVEQRAFLNTVKDKIADTFDATNGTLLKLVRIQQQDSTAARLGMESAMTTFLNNMYDNTEYMSQVMQSVKDTLSESESLMSTTGAVEYEYQVQKWLGSLYSVGFTNTSSIATAIDQLASGDISGLTGSGVGNLLITAANKAGLSLSDVLANGLNGTTTNQLMSAMVSYLQQIAEDTGDSKLLQQQYANVYGLKASDIRAAANLAQSMNDIANNNLSYSGAESQLVSMLGSAYGRTSLGELASNAFNSAMYSMSSGIASDAVLYGTYKIANLLEDVADGMDFSLPLVMGSGTAQTFNIAQLMKAGALGGSILSNLGALFGAGSDISLGSWSSILGLGSSMKTVQRGTGNSLGTLTSGTSTSASTTVSNGNGTDAYNKTVSDTTDSENQKVSAAKNNSDETTLDTVDEHVYAIYTLLNNVISDGNVNVSVANYGLVTNSAGL